MNKIKCKLCGSVDEYDTTNSGVDFCTNCEEEIYVGRNKSIAPWIDIEDRTPEDGDIIIIFCTPIYSDEYITCGYFKNKEFYDNDRTVRVSCWHPMPEIPVFE